MWFKWLFKSKFSFKLFVCVLAILLAEGGYAGAQPAKDIIMTVQPQFENRLANEKSPYLLQHANNPVQWYPWGDEAFQKAKSEDKPVFLSIGYSTCHWCHVMAHESFEVPEVAEWINKYFVPIKVDREERPDIDNIYMSAVMAMTGSGGWPLTVFLTHDKEPFFGGTYFPPYSKWGSPGLVDLMHSIHDAWINNRVQLLKTGSSLTATLKERSNASGNSSEDLSPSVLDRAYRDLAQRHDSHHGGFGSAPKFPMGHNLSYLLRYWNKSGDAKALAIVERTLLKMAEGGVYDHLGGGFHRYATDQEWQIPHFEKMLYDQAILARVYLEAYQITHKSFYARIAREIFDYVLRDMNFASGGFYSAEDADSLDPDLQMTPAKSFQAHTVKEGAFYLWRYDEIKTALGESDSGIFNYYYGIKSAGNAHADPHAEFINKNIIYVQESLEATAEKFSQTVTEIEEILRRSRKKLYDLRCQRPRPHLDDKILVDWNGLMISSLAFGARVLNEPRYGEAAQTAADFLLSTLVNHEGRLLHRYRDGEAAILGSIEDYAFFIYGLLDLYEATFDPKYLSASIRLGEDMIQLFWDDRQGGFYFTAADAEKLLYRQKDVYDGAIPSGNSIAAHDLVRLFHLTFDTKWSEKFEQLFRFFSKNLSAQPSSYCQMLSAFDFVVGPSQEIVVVSAPEDSTSSEVINEIYSHFLPNKVVLMVPSQEIEKSIVNKIFRFTENYKVIEHQTTVYVCQDHVCKLPVHHLDDLRKILDNLTGR